MKMKNLILIVPLILVGCLPYRDINENEVDFALSTLGMSAKYVEDEISNGTIEIDVGVDILTDMLVARSCLLETRKLMAKIKVDQLAQVKIKGPSDEYKYILVEANYTTDIRLILDNNGYNDFEIVKWKLIEADGILVEETIDEE